MIRSSCAVIFVGEGVEERTYRAVVHGIFDDAQMPREPIYHFLGATLQSRIEFGIVPKYFSKDMAGFQRRDSMDRDILQFDFLSV